MTRLHQHFGQALVPIEDGSFIASELQGSLEAFNRDYDFFHQFSQGNVQSFSTFMALHQNQIPEAGVEGISLEAIGDDVKAAVDHPAVKAAIAWLKKWIPIILQKIKELGLRLMAWLKQQYNQTSAKIKRLLKEIDRAITPQVTLTAEGEDESQALALLKDDSILRQVISVTNAEHLVDWCFRANSRVVSIDDPVELDEFEYAVSAMGLWLTNELRHDAFTGRDNENYKTLPAPGIAAGEYSVFQVRGVRTMAPWHTNYTTVAKHLNELDAAQKKLIERVEKLKFKMDSLAVSLGRFRVTEGMAEHKADDVRWVLEMLNWTSAALMHGSRQRQLRIAAAVDLAANTLKLD